MRKSNSNTICFMGKWNAKQGRNANARVQGCDPSHNEDRDTYMRKLLKVHRNQKHLLSTFRHLLSNFSTSSSWSGRRRRDRSVQDCPPMELCLRDLRRILLFCAQTLTNWRHISLPVWDSNKMTWFQILPERYTFSGIKLSQYDPNKALFWGHNNFCLSFCVTRSVPFY